MIHYMVYKEMKEIIADNDVANFGLWYNKFFPVSDKFKPCDNKNNDNMAVKYYKARYQKFVTDNRIIELLKNKNMELYNLSKYYETIGYKSITITATLKTPLVIGLGETHPIETSLLFHHNIGIPYIPASTIKGVVRFQNILKLCENLQPVADKGYIKIPDMPDKENSEINDFIQNFGSVEQRGKIIFLDAFPVKVPELIVDIMNPHYSEYYQGKKPPADYLKPIPINFLAVKPGGEFIFRVLFPKGEKAIDTTNFFEGIFKKALSEEGLGAKTALGYGRFELKVKEQDENLNILKESDQSKSGYRKTKDYMENIISEEMKLENRIKALKKQGKIKPIIGEIWAELRDNKEKYSKNIFTLFRDKLKELGELEPKGNEKSRKKMQKRKDLLVEILKEKENMDG